MRSTFLSFAAVTLASVAVPVFAQTTAQSDLERAIQVAREAAAAADLAARAARDTADAAARAVGQVDLASGRSAGLPASQNQHVESREQREARERARLASVSASRMEAGITEGVANGPNGRSLKSTASPDLQLIATSKDKVASLAWTFDVSRSSGSGRMHATQLTATATSALDSQGQAEILGLKGFPGGTELSLNLIHYIAGFKANGKERDEVKTARDKCRITNANSVDLEKLCNPYDFAGGVSRFVEKYYPDGLRPMLRSVMPGNVYFVGGEVTANQTDFDYLDQPSFTMQSVSKFGYSGTLFGGLILPSGQTSFTGSFTYSRKYKAADSITLCQAINAVPQTQCITAPGAAPSNRTRAIASLEIRHAFPVDVGEFARFAVAPEFSVDLKSDAYSIDMPIYLMGDGKGKLRGGVRLGYLNTKKAAGGREDDFSLGLFVGVPFSVFR